MLTQLQKIKKFICHKSFWLFATLSSLATLDLYYIWKITGKTPILINFLCWGSIFFLLWKKRNEIKFRGNIISIVIGSLLILCINVRHILSQLNYTKEIVDVFSRIFPVVNLIGILLILSGFKRLIYYKSEILLSIANFILYPFLVLSNVTRINPFIYIDSQLTTFILHYVGFQVTRQGSIVSLSNGSINIFAGCSSFVPLLSIFPIMVIFLTSYATNRITKIYIFVVAIVAIFLMNAIRLCFLAISLNKIDMSTFNYWHEGEGVNIFSNLIVFMITGLSYQILNWQNLAKTKQKH